MAPSSLSKSCNRKLHHTKEPSNTPSQFGFWTQRPRTQPWHSPDPSLLFPNSYPPHPRRLGRPHRNADQNLVRILLVLCVILSPPCLTQHHPCHLELGHQHRALRPLHRSLGSPHPGPPHGLPNHHPLHPRHWHGRNFYPHPRFIRLAHLGILGACRTMAINFPTVAAHGRMVLQLYRGREKLWSPVV